MKISLNYQHSTEDLSKADELIIPYGKVESLVEIVEKFPNKDLVIDLPKGLTLDWKMVSACAKQLKDGAELYICLHDLTTYMYLGKAKEYNLKFFFSEAVKTFYDLYALKKLGVSYVYVDAPLFFQMDEVKKVGIPLRLIPNKCYTSGYIPKADGLHGCWIRPEKLYLYEKYAEVLEFFNLGAKQEMALYRIYIENKEWPGDMNSIFHGFNLHMDNRLVYEGLDEMRLNCGQKCETTKPYCHMCDEVKRFEIIGREWANEVIKRQNNNNL